MKTKPLMLVLLFSAILNGGTSAPAYARGQEGHGGRVWACEVTNSDGAKSIRYELLDYQLARQKLTLQYETGTVLEQIQKLLGRLQVIEPDRARIYFERANHFFDPNKIVWEKDVVEYVNLDDLKQVISKREGCELKQVIYQHVEKDPDTEVERLTFKFAQLTWDKLDDSTKAGLILHELFLEDLSNQADFTADPAMVLNGYLASEQIKNMSRDEWIKTLQKQQAGYHHQGFLIAPSGFDQQGRLVEGIAISTKDLSLNRVKIQGQDTYAVVNNKITFYPDAGPKGVVLSKSDRFDRIKYKIDQPNAEAKSLKLELMGIWYQDGSIVFHPNGAIASIRLEATSGKEPYQRLRIRIQDKNVRLRDIIFFTPEGKVSGGVVGKKVSLRTALGRTRTFKSGELILLDQDDNVLDGVIYSIQDPSRYIQVLKNGSQIGFKYCWFGGPSDCTQIGNREYYDKKDLERVLKFSMKKIAIEDVLSASGSYSSAGEGDRVDARDVLVTGVWDFFLSAPTTLGLGIATGPVGATVSVGVFLTKGLIVDPIRGRMRENTVKNKVLNQEYVYTDRSFDSLIKSIEGSLAKIK